MLLEIETIMHNIRDARRGLFVLDSRDLSDEQTVAVEEARLALNEFAHKARIVEFELNNG